MAKLSVNGQTGCWDWTGSCNLNGYGQVSVHDKMRRPHRVLYELLIGPLPADLDLDHLCRNRRCCNPEHLEPVTRRENARRGLRGILSTPLCPRGHDDWRRNNRGHRYCAECNRQRARAYKHRAVA